MHDPDQSRGVEQTSVVKKNVPTYQNFVNAFLTSSKVSKNGFLVLKICVQPQPERVEKLINTHKLTTTKKNSTPGPVLETLD